MKKISFNKEAIKTGLKRWFQFNYHTIAIYFTAIGTIVYTATMPTHIKTVYNLLNELSAFYMFMMMILATIQIFNAVSYAKKKSPFGFVLFTLVTLLELFFSYKFVSVVFNEVSTRPDLEMLPFMSQSITLIITGAIMFIIANVYNGFIINWKYVKEEE